MDTVKFPLGRTVATPGALDAIKEAGEDPTSYLDRHITGDWGIVPPNDAAANERALVNDDRIISSYALKTGGRIWIITEADRSSTAILLPEEY